MADYVRIDHRDPEYFKGLDPEAVTRQLWIEQADEKTVRAVHWYLATYALFGSMDEIAASQGIETQQFVQILDTTESLVKRSLGYTGAARKASTRTLHQSEVY